MSLVQTKCSRIEQASLVIDPMACTKVDDSRVPSIPFIPPVLHHIDHAPTCIPIVVIGALAVLPIRTRRAHTFLDDELESLDIIAVADSNLVHFAFVLQLLEHVPCFKSELGCMER